MPQARIYKDQMYKLTTAKFEHLRNAFRFMTHHESIPAPIRYQAQMQLNQFPIASRLHSIRNRCIETGRARWIIHDFKLTRHAFRKKALKGELEGVTKSNW
ncbi:40S ribosomal protein mrp2, mitochondrial [Coelomomyces lativittatus]|nr:40S ribosomal protein mrp2, mitochondrial [Coelomomyces lativittatus]KAJ1502230.1 40S ribosomal protein mrp2, mitochondrial [Coelomomyces lativittatus]KAJ1514300.1 40S ribosomal protein mrp2, mitochondrial [Coelomomyces lativittatus]